MTELTRAEYLLGHEKYMVHGVKDRWPFRHFYRVVDDPMKPPAWCRGVFNITATFNMAHLGEASTAYRAFVCDHELTHLREHHGFWSLLCFLVCLPLWPILRVAQEWRADYVGARALTKDQVRRVCYTLDNPDSWKHRALYGSPEARAERATWNRKR